MRPEIALATLRASRRSIMWWSLGVAGLVVLMIAVYPSIRDNPMFDQILKDYPDAIKEFVSFGGAFDYTSPTGYLGAELFSMMLPLLFIIAAVVAGSKAIAGEEEAGTLDLILSMPVSRTRVLLEKALAIAVEMVILGAVVFVVVWVGALAVGMDIGVGNLLAAAFDVVMIGWLYGALALMLGAAIGRRGIAAGVAAALAVIAYVINGLAPLVGVFDDIRPASPWSHYVASDALGAGLDPLHVGVLLGITAVLVAVAPPLLLRRDIGV